MSYRIIKIASYYRNFLHAYHQKFPEVVNFDYQTQLVHLFKQGVAWADFFSVHLNKLGVQACEVIHNDHILQMQWAFERNLKNFNSENILLEQIKEYRPDVVFFQDTVSFTNDFLNELRAKVTSLKLIIGHVCSPVPGDQYNIFRNYDLIFSCPALYHKMKAGGVNNLFEFHHGFEVSLINQLAIENRYSESDVIFAGAFLQGVDFHDHRMDVIKSIVEKDVEISIYADVLNESGANLFVKQVAFDIIRLLNRLKLQGLISHFKELKRLSVLKQRPKKNDFLSSLSNGRILSPLFGLEMLKAIYKSKIGLNIHGGIANNYASNVRMFEVAGCGTLLLTDKKDNISELFEVDKEIVCYDSIPDCLDKIAWLLEHDKERESIARAGQERIIRDHSLENRVKNLHQIIESRL